MLARKSEAAAPSTAKAFSKSAFSGLRVGDANSAFECEADRVADDVMASEKPRIDWSLSRMSIMPSQGQRSGQVQPENVPPVVSEVLNSAGRPLDQDTRNFFEPRFGHKLDAVRIHHDQGAAEATQQVGARAYTVGNHVFFGAGRYTPGASAGCRLLAHELAHVLQQRVIGPTLQRDELEGGSTRNIASSTAGKGTSRAGAALKVYRYAVDGHTVTLTEEQYKAEVARAAHNLAVDFKRVEGIAQVHREEARDFLARVHGTHWYSVGTISDIVGDAIPPDKGIWSYPNAAIKNGRTAAAQGNLASAARQLQLAESALKDAIHEWNVYMGKTIGGAEVTEHVLETTRDVSFSIAVGTAAVVALPIVAAGASAAATGAGLTGTAATIAAGAGTLGTITAGGAVVGGGLRAGSSAAGQKLAGNAVSGGEAWKEFKEGAKHGAVDASTAVLTAGVGKALGPSKNLAGRTLKSAAAAGTGSGLGSGLGATLEGKSPKEVAKATFVGTVGGVAGGTLGTVGGHILGESGVARVLTGGLGGAGGAAASTLAAGDSLKDAKSTLITSALAGGVAASGEHPSTTVSETTAGSQAEQIGAPETSSAEAKVSSSPERESPVASKSKETPSARGNIPVKGPGIWEEISNELSLESPGSGSQTQSVRGAVADAQAAGFVGPGGTPGSVDAAFQSHGSAPTVRSELGVSGSQAQSAHVGPTSALRDVLGYTRSGADTMMLDPKTHAAFDNHWKTWAKSMRRQGHATCTVGELYNVMLEAIDQIPDTNMSPRTKNALSWRLQLELSKDLGLQPNASISLPYKNIRPSGGR
jgi:hypothetical protein